MAGNTAAADPAAAAAEASVPSAAGAEETRVNSVADLAKRADQAFEAQQFDDCLELLAKVRQQKEDDPKVQHNTCIAR